LSKHHGLSPQQQSVAGPALIEAGEQQIRQLLANGNSRSAVDRAKELHKQINNAASEALLVEAYRARIGSLREHRMDAEADALAKLVLERYPSAAKALKDPAPGTKTAILKLDDLVRPLADAQLPSEQRGAIESELKKRLDDPSALANGPALPTDHPLRLQARAVADAFTAVTRGPVTDEQVELNSVSRRSPLAPWKALVRAIAAFYERDDAAAERYLQSIDAESPAVRAAAPLRSAIAGKVDPQLKPAARSLYDGVSGAAAALRDALDTLDSMLSSNKKTKAISQIQSVIKLAAQAAPDLVPRLRQHIEIRGDTYELDPDRLRGALGGITLKDAYFWLLSARTAEDPKKPSFIPASCMWEEFRKHAIHEGWFEGRGPEVAALWVHMAGLLGMEGEVLEEARREFRGFPGLAALMYDDQPKEIRAALAGSNPADQYYLDPEKLFQRACAADPRAETFQQWMAWAAATDSSDKGRDKVAEAWRRALPNDVRPLLALTVTAGKRDALQKAIGFLEKAEKLDPLNPDVRRARVQMLVGSALKRLRERHAHLALRDVAVLEKLPQARETACSAVICALRYLCCLQNRDEAGMSEQLRSASEALGSEVVARCLFGNIARLSGFSPPKYPGLGQLTDLTMQPAESIAGVVASVLLIGDAFSMAFPFPDVPTDLLVKEVRARGEKLDNAQLRALGEAAVRDGEAEVAYAVSVAGLARGSSDARFLLIRAQSLPENETNRSSECLDAAAELARRNRDMQLLDQIVEERRESFSAFATRIFDLPDERRELSETELNGILKRERKAVAYPAQKRSPAHRKRLWDKFSSMFGDEDEEDEFYGEDDPFEGIPADAFHAFVEEAARAMQSRTSGGAKRKRGGGRKSPF